MVSSSRPKLAFVLLAVASLCLLIVLMINREKRPEGAKSPSAVRFDPITDDIALSRIALSRSKATLIGGTTILVEETVPGTNITLVNSGWSAFRDRSENAKVVYGSVVLWDCSTGKILREVGEFEGDVDWVDVSENDDVYAGASTRSGQVMAWNVRDGMLLLDQRVDGFPETATLPTISLSRDGRMIAVAQKDKEGRLQAPASSSAWSDRCDLIVYRLNGDESIQVSIEGLTNAIEFCADDALIAVLSAVASMDDPQRFIHSYRLDVYESATLNRIHTTTMPTCFSSSIAAVPGTSQVLVSMNQRMSVYDVRSGDLVIAYDAPSFGGTLLAHRINPEGTFYAWCNATSWIDLIDLRSGSVERINVEAVGNVRAFDADLSLMIYDNEMGRRPRMIPLR